MAEILLCCGKICSGKSTFARLMEERHGFFHFSADQWMLHFYEETTDRALFDRRLNNCKEMIFSIAYKLLDHGQDVVLDFGFCKKAERRSLCADARSRGHEAVVVYFPIDYGTQVEHMKKRQTSRTEDHYTFTENAVQDLNRLFEEPDETEVVVPANEYLKRYDVHSAKN